MDNSNIVSIINDKMSSFNKNGKKISEYVLEHLEEVSTLSADKLRHRIGVSETTIRRYVNRLGFDDFQSFSLAIKDYLAGEPSKLENVQDDEERVFVAEESVISKIGQYELSRIKQMYDNIDEVMINEAVNVVDKADKVYVVGVRENAPVAQYLAEGFLNMGKEVVLITDTIMEKMYRITSNDVLVVVCFPDYSYKVIKAMEYANLKQTSIIAITDDKNSPVGIYATCVLCAPAKRYGMLYSMTCAMSLSNLMIATLMSTHLNEYEEDFSKRLEAMEYDYVGNDFINPLNLNFGID